MQGRKPTPSAIKVLAGNPGHRPINENEPKPRIERAACPSHISGPARKLWRLITDELVSLGVLTILDYTVLEIYCSAYQIWRAAKAKVDTEGSELAPPVQGQERETLFGTIPASYAPSQKVINQSLNIMAMKEKTMIKLASELGLTPSARTRLQSSAEQPDDPLDSFLNDESERPVTTQ
jgi:P27 family predicted phage terminase small subunit